MYDSIKRGHIFVNKYLRKTLINIEICYEISGKMRCYNLINLVKTVLCFVTVSHENVK